MLTYSFSSRTLRTIVFLVIVLPSLSIAQIVNGSFELDGQPSLAGWNFSCHGHTTVKESPFDSNGYCLKLEAGNFQGCLPDVKNGDVWQIEGWAKAGARYPFPGIYFGILLNGGIVLGNGVFSISNFWKHLSVQDTMKFSDGDTVVIVLSAGNSSGPATGWSYFDLISVSKVIATGINHDPLPENNPTRFTLHQNYPNPFNPTTTIKFSTPTRAMVSLKVYNILGRELETLFSGETEAGKHSMHWDAERFSSGVYIYALTANGYTERKRMLLLK
jgi:hypothetical protein